MSHLFVARLFFILKMRYVGTCAAAFKGTVVVFLLIFDMRLCWRFPNLWWILDLALTPYRSLSSASSSLSSTRFKIVLSYFACSEGYCYWMKI